MVDGGNWLMTPRLADKEVIRAISRAVERRSRSSKREAGGEDSRKGNTSSTGSSGGGGNSGDGGRQAAEQAREVKIRSKM